MGDISPVLQSYLAGYHGRLEGLKEGYGYKIKKEHLDEMIKQFEVEQKNKEKAHQLQVDLFNLHRQTALEEAKRNWIEELTKNPSLAPQQATPTGFPTFNRETNPSTGETMNIPGLQGTTQQTPPYAGTPISMPTAYGENVQFNMPRPAEDIAVEQARRIAEAKAPTDISTYEATVGKTNTQRLANALQISENKIEQLNNMWSNRLDVQKQLGELRATTAENVASMKAAFDMQKMLFGMGFGGGEDMAKTILQYARERATGKLDNTSLKGTPLNNLVENAMRQSGLTDLPGGAKTRQNILGMGTEGAALLNKFDDIVTLYPPSDKLTGRISKAVQNINVPFYGPVSELGLKYKEFESNLMNYAKTTAGITSSRLLDSNKEQARFMGSLPNTADRTETIKDKRINLIDNIFTHIQAGISGLSTEQKKDFWIDIFKNNPTYTDLAQDNAFRKNVMLKIFETGNFDSSYLNPMRRSGQIGR